MKICSDTKLQPEQQVNRIGKYLYKTIDGAYKIKFGVMTCDIYMIMYYQTSGNSESFKEMRIDINITTYQKKIRVNVIEMTDYEKTLGCSVYKPDQIKVLSEARKLIYNDICKHISKAYSDYDFIF